MLYNLFKWLFALAAPSYFRHIQVSGLENFPAKGPVILAANHPSAFMDPILVALHTQRRVHFLARAESFRSPLARWLFPKLNMIPVYRQHTTPGEMHKNAAMFEACTRHLLDDGTLLIFPEGISTGQRRISPVKTGAARIALETASHTGFAVDVPIVPIGLNYSNPHLFRSDVAIRIGKPIGTGEFKAGYEADAVSAVQAMTAQLQERLEALTVVIRNEALDQLVENIIRVQTPPGTLPEERYALSQRVSDAVAFFYQVDPARVARVEDKVHSYLQQVKVMQLPESVLKSTEYKKPLRRQLGFLLVGFIPALVGWVFNYPPYRLTGLLAKAINRDDDFEGSIKLAGGMLTFLAFYGCYFWAFLQVGDWWLAPLGVLVCYLLGFVTLSYARVWYHWQQSRMIRNRLMKRSTLMENLVNLRKDILADLEQGGNDYNALQQSLENISTE